MASLSVFCDEAGQRDMSAGYYLLTLVLHDQSTPLGPFVSDYESHVALNGLPDIAFHMKDLLHGHGDYERDGRRMRRRRPTESQATSPKTLGLCHAAQTRPPSRARPATARRM